MIHQNIFRLFAWLLLVVAAVVPSYAKETPAGTADNEVEYYRVVGAVIDVWGNPLPGAFVKSGAGMEAVTDADGTFSIFLAPDDTKLTASYPGLFSKKMGVKKQPVVFELQEKEKADASPARTQPRSGIRITQGGPR